MADYMADYNGESDLFDFAENLKHGVTHGHCHNNFEIPHEIPHDNSFNLDDDAVNLEQQPSPRSLNHINHSQSQGQQFVTENSQNNLPLDEDIMKILGLTDQEMEANLNPDFNDFDQNASKCASQEEPTDLHGNEIEYDFSPAGSSGHQDFQQHHAVTEDHASSLVPKIPEDYENSQIVIDNQENVPTTTIKDPKSGAFYEVTNTELSQFLYNRGMKRVETPKLSKREIDQLVRRFCIPREMNFVTSDDAKRLVKSGYTIKRVEKKSMKRTAETKKALDQFACLLCPLTQNHSRKFARKEDLKRHYHQHLSFVRFHCNLCDYKISRIDHIRTHMATCHDNSNQFTKLD